MSDENGTTYIRRKDIFLDDIRNPPNGDFITVRTAKECFEMLVRERGNVVVLSLDHDLGEESIATGYDLCKDIISWAMDNLDYSIYPDVIYLHTSNPVGRDNMFQLLKYYAPPHVKIYRHGIGQ